MSSRFGYSCRKTRRNLKESLPDWNCNCGQTICINSINEFCPKGTTHAGVKTLITRDYYHGQFDATGESLIPQNIISQNGCRKEQDNTDDEHPKCYRDTISVPFVWKLKPRAWLAQRRCNLSAHLALTARHAHETSEATGICTCTARHTRCYSGRPIPPFDAEKIFERAFEFRRIASYVACHGQICKNSETEVIGVAIDQKSGEFGLYTLQCIHGNKIPVVLNGNCTDDSQSI